MQAIRAWIGVASIIRRDSRIIAEINSKAPGLRLAKLYGVPMLVEASVQASLTVVPGAVNVGNPKVGELVTRRIVVTGSKPFKITSIEGASDGIETEVLNCLAESASVVTSAPTAAAAGGFRAGGGPPGL